MSEWKEYKMSDIASVIDCEHKTAPVVSDSQYYSIRTSNISHGKIDYENSNRVDYQTYLKWTKRGFPNAGDIILAREAPVGEVGIIKEGYKVCLGQRTVLLSILSKEVHNKYLLYYLVNPLIKHELIVRSTGSVVAHLNMKDIRAFILKLPPISTQKAVASVLSSLDDKIDLLHRQNKTLEEMAETLFRQWFVEFEFPNDRGKFYKNSDCKMVDSELGEIPVNWKLGELKDLLEIKYGKDHKHLETGTIPVYGSGGIMRYVDKALYSEESILIPRKGTLSNLFYLNKPFWSVDTMFYSKIKRNEYGKYCFLFLKSRNLAAMNVGSAVPSLTTKLLNAIKIVIPDEDIMKKFDSIVSTFFHKIKSNEKQIETLESLRDTLLPKLMSGEMRVD